MYTLTPQIDNLPYAGKLRIAAGTPGIEQLRRVLLQLSRVSRHSIAHRLIRFLKSVLFQLAI
jgi:hypothetical protein